MQITTQIKLFPTTEQIILIKNTLQEYISTANNVVNDYVIGDKTIKHTSKSVIADLPSALKNQVIQDAKSIFRKYTKNLKATLKKNLTSKRKLKFQFSKNQWQSGIIKTILSSLAILHFQSGLMVKALELR